MRKFLFILLLVVALSSCKNLYVADGESIIDKEKETTLSILNKIDTTNTYYIVIEDKSTLVAVNTRTKIVEHRIPDGSGAALFLLTLVIVLIICVSILFSFLN